MFNYNPFVGCKKCSRSCDYCAPYHKTKYTGIIKKSDTFDVLTRKFPDGRYVVKPNSHVEVSPYTDIFLEDVRVYLDELLNMFSIRKDLFFHVKTKRLSRVIDELPLDFETLYPNLSITVVVCDSYEFKREVSSLKKLNLNDKRVLITTMYDSINILDTLDNNYGIKEIAVMGNDFTTLPLHYDQLVKLSNDTKKLNIAFNFISTGKCIIKDNKKYYISYSKRITQAFRSGLSHD